MIKKLINLGLIVSLGVPILTIFPIYLKLRILFLILLIGVSLFDFMKFKVFTKNIYILFVFSYVFSLLVGGIIWPDLFLENLKNMKIIISFMIIFSLRRIQKDEFVFIKNWIIRLSIINVFWGLLQMIYYFNNKSLNNSLFLNQAIKSEILGRYDLDVYTYNSTSLIKIRLTGLSWDPFYLGMFSLITVIMAKNKVIKLLSLITLIFSYSRSAYLGFFFYLAYSLIQYINLKYKKQVGIIFNIIIMLIGPFLLGFIYFIRKQNESLRRIGYYLFPFEILNENYFNFMFGGSPIYGGSIINKYSEIAKKYQINEETLYWTIESDVANILIGRGLIGLSIYFCMLISIYKNKKIELKIKKCILSLAFAGIGYGIISQPLILFFIGNIFSYYSKANQEERC